MARGRKKENLTPEELLQAALVPESEQPYKIPENWCWTHLGKLYQINPKNLAEDFVDAAFIPMEKIAPGFVNEYSFDVQPWCKAKKGHTQFADGDVAFAKISPCFENRKSMLLNNLPNGIGGGTTELVILRQSHMNQKYTFWFISQEQFIRGGIATYSGTVGQQRISMDYVRTYPIPVPPLLEQQRIVDRIESLFAKLDEAKQKALATLDSFETRKAAILHKAFTGELTARWRQAKGKKFSVTKHSLNEVFNFIDYRGMTPDKTDSGVPLITAKNIKKGYIDYRVSEFISHDTYLQRQSRGIAHRDDLLITTEAPLGNVALADRDIYSTAQRVIVLQVRDEYVSDVYNKYVMYYMLNDEFQNCLESQKTGSTVAGIKAAKLKLISIELPDVVEQTEIVRILDDLLAKEQQAKEAAEKVLEQIDLIKKSILARAFRGELGTNDPSEESAVELLKQVL